ncbi:dehydrogenase [Verrucomicrobia bacterium LW23]|nr:dehydrogenase [Verrucomicrobia bacterium LW23]
MSQISPAPLAEAPADPAPTADETPRRIVTPDSGRTRYALVGTGSRSWMFCDAIMRLYKDTAELVGLCDSNSIRLSHRNEAFRERLKHDPVPAYKPADFDRMIAEQRPQVVIVTTMDSTHHNYIIRAMELGCDVITEKPMTTDADKCQAIIDTQKRTGRNVRVTFNYRYAPSRTKVKELIRAGAIGDVKSVHFEWLLDTRHGADYFRRWHRDKANSGGLMVHKSTHHFDLVNWWIDSAPVTVFGLGQLAFYGRNNAEARGDYRPYVRSTDSPEAVGDRFALNLRDGGSLEKLYLDAEREDGYMRDQNVFGEGINIEDTMNVLVRYENGAQLSYSLTAYSPWEGFRVAFNGTRGRIELDEMEKSYIAAGNGHITDGLTTSRRLTVFPHWDKPSHIEIPEATGGHGGGDLLLLEDLFGSGARNDPLGRAAGHVDGARSILTGIAANKSFETGLPVDVRKLVRF